MSSPESGQNVSGCGSEARDFSAYVREEPGDFMSRADAKIIYTGPSPRGWHRLQQAAECLQKYAWKYERPTPEGQKKVTSPALAKGSLIHLGLAQYYARMRANQQGNPVDEWCSPEEAIRLIAKLEGTDEHANVAIEAVQAHQAHYRDDFERWKILDIEDLLQTQVNGKYLLTGRIDLAYEDLGGRIWVVDHKTTARLTSRHGQFYAISGQLLGYSHMARQKYGDRYAGLIVNLIQHTTPKFERITLPRSPNLEARFEKIVVDIEESIERVQAEGREVDDWPKAINELTCFHRYGACEFMDQCRWGPGAKTAGNWSIGSWH